MCDFTTIPNPDGSKSPVGVDLLGQGSADFDEDESNRTSATIDSLTKDFSRRGGGRREKPYLAEPNSADVAAQT